MTKSMVFCGFFMVLLAISAPRSEGKTVAVYYFVGGRMRNYITVS